MKRAGISVAVAGALLVSLAPAAQAAAGRVVVFETELQKLTVYRNPSGCTKLPLASHVLMNLTNDDVTTYADPFCLTPGLTVAPDHGTHIAPGTGSFRV
ncbi:hypothetical protein Lesp02_40200 [Lentzea sp. NBRC 105346]|uniref:hypothetical protein n=1 Tax=Lentzea sp. NBRC 105346 TaxID=3032205 RepID=UPI0024A1DF1C|nr:hypothetical protein [Lentzea sp. NBRC 105346]GLZ31832.1 hypothetical protein Lesp02_40200 [Lentzea sp. NBRC 105346]